MSESTDNNMSSDEEEQVVAAEGEEVETESQVTDLTNSDVVTKYQEAAKIVNLTIKGLALKCTAGTGSFFLPGTQVFRTALLPGALCPHPRVLHGVAAA